MKLDEILNKITLDFEIKTYNINISSLIVSSIEIDSRQVKKDSVFFAISGIKNDGKLYIKNALEAGAKVIVSNQDFDLEDSKNHDFIFIKSEENFKLLVEFLKIFYHPLPNNIYAITGTNGKTSTAEFLRQILKFAGKKSASIGTLGLICDEDISKIKIPNLTTLDIVTNYKILYFLKSKNIDDVAMELSSIGLEQERVAGIKVNCAIFTNFSQDHLDYHQTMSKYFQCKMLLFSKVLSQNDLAIINSDIKEYQKITKICQDRQINIVDYGQNAKKFKIISISANENGQKITLQFNENLLEFSIVSKVIFDAYNIISALAAIITQYQLSFTEINKILNQTILLKSALGRMQKIATLKNNAQIFIDFAHTPDSIKQILEQARNISNQKIFILFGCGGNRDTIKRPIMGQIACDLADFVIITDDNPRHEDPKNIRQDIIKACKKDNFIEINDRKIAIKQAINMLQNDDILILAGKGHEKYQIIGDNKIEFDEEKIVRQYIESAQL